jgi:hypothetical protein
MVVLLEKIFLSHLRLRHIFITLEQPERLNLSPAAPAAHSPASHSKRARERENETAAFTLAPVLRADSGGERLDTRPITAGIGHSDVFRTRTHRPSCTQRRPLNRGSHRRPNSDTGRVGRAARATSRGEIRFWAILSTSVGATDGRRSAACDCEPRQP